MDANEKRRINVNICGSNLTLVTDESDEFVTSVTKELSERMTSLTQTGFRINRTDAALLCAIDYLGDRIRAERKIKSLEAALALADINMEKMRAELDTNDSESAASSPAEAKEAVDKVRSASTGERVAELENYLENAKSSRKEKIDYIESLLRK